LAHRLSKGQISRREFTNGLALLAGVGALGLSGRVQAQSGRLVYVNWGGDAIDAMMEAFGRRFAEETGITVVFDGTGPTEGAVMAQAETGSPTWDLCDCEPNSGQALGKQGLMRLSVIEPELGLQNYSATLTDPLVLSVYWRTLRICLTLLAPDIIEAILDE